jgi:hypothetical protein
MLAGPEAGEVEVWHARQPRETTLVLWAVENA